MGDLTGDVNDDGIVDFVDLGWNVRGLRRVVNLRNRPGVGLDFRGCDLQSSDGRGKDNKR